MFRRAPDAGFSLAELMIAMAVMLLVSGAATTALLKMTSTQATIWNRTQMHSGIRGATEVLQQEVGQAGRIALASASATCTSNTNMPCFTTAITTTGSGTYNVSSVCGLFVGEKITVDTGTSQESVAITQINGTASDPSETTCPTGATISAGTITGVFANTHVIYTPIQAFGGFAAGIVPASTTNGSTSSVLKLFGDVNADGNLMYVEYSITPTCICSATCSPSTTVGNLYRNAMQWNKTTKIAASASQVLLSNITANPNGTACFTYQTATVNSITYVTDVAITLTVQTQIIDPVTKAYQTETKALLNVSPRNVFNIWEFASLGYTDRIQATPGKVTALLAGTGS